MTAATLPAVPAGEAIESASFRYIDAVVNTNNTHKNNKKKLYNRSQWALVSRLIHTSGDFEFNGLTRFHPEAVDAGMRALHHRAPLVVDVAMVAAGLTARRLKPLGITVHHFNADWETVKRARMEKTTRSVQAIRIAHQKGLLTHGIVAIGNAPTALMETIRLIQEGRARPALVVGMPVGFISAAESKTSLMTLTDTPWITVQGTKGGSTLTVAALHALMDLTI